jgi:hypothetical protein
MDEAVRRFRRQARVEIGERFGAERRYSGPLRQAAVAYWRRREPEGDGLRTVAAALGVAPVSLRRWARDDRFRAVTVIDDPGPTTSVTVVVEATGLRVEGLDVATAAALIARLR